MLLIHDTKYKKFISHKYITDFYLMVDRDTDGENISKLYVNTPESVIVCTIHDEQTCDYIKNPKVSVDIFSTDNIVMLNCEIDDMQTKYEY